MQYGSIEKLYCVEHIFLGTFQTFLETVFIDYLLGTVPISETICFVKIFNLKNLEDVFS